MKKLSVIFTSFILFLSASNISLAADFETVSPSQLDLIIEPGSTSIQNVSITIHPLCIRPFLVDVVASTPDATITNLTGEILNGCGGDTSSFEVEFNGLDIPQAFDIQFVDAEFGGILGTIPVTIKPERLMVEPLMGTIILKHTIGFQVASNGCTNKEDFKLEVLESHPIQLRLIRLREDLCDAYVPLGKGFLFTYRELGLSPGAQIRVVNPLATVTVPPH